MDDGWKDLQNSTKTFPSAVTASSQLSVVITKTSFSSLISQFTAAINSKAAKTTFIVTGPRFQKDVLILRKVECFVYERKVDVCFRIKKVPSCARMCLDKGFDWLSLIVCLRLVLRF